MDPVISVIVCTYNQEDTIGRTLEGILSQQCTVPVEIVVGEDCSKDGTLTICRQYAQRYPNQIRLMANCPNKGITDNYFDCMMACRGKYIADCAGDDYWSDPLKLQKEYDLMEKHPDVAIVHTDWQYYNEQTGERKPSPQWRAYDIVDGTTLLEDIITQTHRPAIHLCTSLYRADWIKEAHDQYRSYFRNPDYPCEDLQVSFFLAMKGRVAYLPDVTLNYSWGGESISNSEDSARLYRFYHKATKQSYDLAACFHLLTPRLSAFLQWRCYELMMHAFRSGNKELRQEAITLPKQWNVPMNARMRMVKWITCNPLTWRASLGLRQILVG